MNDIKIGCGVKGMYKIQVLENGRVVEDRPWAKNMILDQGLDYALSLRLNSVPLLFRYHCLGSGTTAVSASQTGLVTELKRTGTLVTGNCGQTIAGGTITFRYTWDHAVEGVGGANYAEHGISPYASAGNNLFARSLISGGTVSVPEGQQLRVIYDVSVAVSPSAPSPATVGGTGWPVSPATNCDGDAVLLYWDTVTGTLDTYGNTGGASFLTFSSFQQECFPVSEITLPGGIGSVGAYTQISDSSIQYVANAYTTGSFTRTISPTGYATAGGWSSTSIAGWHFTSAGYNALAFKYDQKQTKANTHRLRYPSITITWARA